MNAGEVLVLCLMIAALAAAGIAQMISDIITCGKCKMYDGKNHTCKVRNKNEIYTKTDFCSWGVKK